MFVLHKKNWNQAYLGSDVSNGLPERKVPILANTPVIRCTFSYSVVSALLIVAHFAKTEHSVGIKIIPQLCTAAVSLTYQMTHQLMLYS